MPENTKVICITCPKGCRLDVSKEGDTILSVDNCGCKRGEEYVKAELTDPRRMVATTVKIRGSLHPLLPVYTAKPFPKPRIRELLDRAAAGGAERAGGDGGGGGEGRAGDGHRYPRQPGDETGSLIYN